MIIASDIFMSLFFLYAWISIKRTSSRTALASVKSLVSDRLHPRNAGSPRFYIDVYSGIDMIPSKVKQDSSNRNQLSPGFESG